jgi:hypothetical protein
MQCIYANQQYLHALGLLYFDFVLCCILQMLEWRICKVKNPNAEMLYKLWFLDSGAAYSRAAARVPQSGRAANIISAVYNFPKVRADHTDTPVDRALHVGRHEAMTQHGQLRKYVGPACCICQM